MNSTTQGGILLLPVALTLALVGTLAYMLTRDGSMSASEVDAQYDIEVANYLVAAGLNLARWQNEKIGCSSTRKFTKVKLPGGEISADEVSIEGASWNIGVKAETGRTTRSKSDYKATRYNRANAQTASPIIPAGANDTSITKDNPGIPLDAATLQVSAGKSHALIRFPSLQGVPDNALVVSAELTLTHTSSNTQMPRALGVHRLTRDWGSNVNWTSPWSSDGGDYVPVPVWTVDINGNSNANVNYSLRIDPIVQGWLDDPLRKRNVLLKPVGPLDAKFHSLDAASANKPRLVVRYYPRC